MTAQDSFRFEIRDGRIVVTGELDMRSGAEMAASLLALAVEANRLAVDLTEVSFMDARGLRALLFVKDVHPAVSVIAVSPRVERVLEITDTYAALVDSDLGATG
jgi:anti-anti-sigma factor